MESKINFTLLDMYSKKLGFFYDNHEKIGSFFGFFLTMFYIFASLTLFIYLIIKTIQRRELKVYDTTIYSQEMPIIDIDINNLYFAFGLEYPGSANRYIDESIYTVKITFIDQQKKQDRFVTVNQQNLQFEKCNVDNFGKEYQNLFVKDELNNSYCLKDFNYNLTLAGSYKFERITYIRIMVYPCVNNSKNNYSCKPQEVIDSYLNNGYFSIVLKDFGLNPSNYSYPRIPTLQDLYTTIDKGLYKNYILNFGLTEIQTDRGLLREQINKERYLQFRKVLESFSFREEKDYHAGKSLILIQLRLEDTIFVQKRTYTKISEILSLIGGYMQLMNTIFLLVSSIINNVSSEIKIINSIFNFNIKENKMILKLQFLKDFNKAFSLKNKNIIFSLKRNSNHVNKIESENKSKNNLIIKDIDINNISSLNNSALLNNSSNKKIANQSQNCTIKINKKQNIIPFDNSKNYYKYTKKESEQNNQNSNINYTSDNLQKIFFNLNSKENIKYTEFNDHIDLNIFDYFCSRKNSKKKRHVKLYSDGNRFFRKKMDIVHIFSLLLLIENIIKNNY